MLECRFNKTTHHVSVRLCDRLPPGPSPRLYGRGPGLPTEEATSQTGLIERGLREQHLAGVGSMCLLFCLKQTRWGAGPGPQDREWCVLTWRIGVGLGEHPTSLDGR